jgi:DNA-binding NtrC family response regulator
MTPVGVGIIGSQFIAELHAEAFKRVPDAKVIAMTAGRRDTNFLDVAKLFGAHRTLEKPFKIEDMLKAVREELKKKPGNQTTGPPS